MIAGFESRRRESELSLLQLLMARIAMLLLVYGIALLVVIEFAYRHLIAAPKTWLVRRLGWPRATSRQQPVSDPPLSPHSRQSPSLFG